MDTSTNLEGNFETPMNTSSSPTRPNVESFTCHSFHTPYKVEQSVNQFNQTQKQFDNRYLTTQAVSK